MQKNANHSKTNHKDSTPLCSQCSNYQTLPWPVGIEFNQRWAVLPPPCLWKLQRLPIILFHLQKCKQSRNSPLAIFLSFIFKTLMLVSPLTLRTQPKNLTWSDNLFTQKRGAYTPQHFSLACPSVRRLGFKIFKLVGRLILFIQSLYIYNIYILYTYTKIRMP